VKEHCKYRYNFDICNILVITCRHFVWVVWVMKNIEKIV